MISYPLSFPANVPGYRSLSILPENSVGRAESKFNYKQQIYKNSGQRWVLNIQWPTLTREQGNALKAFIVSLNGSVGTFIAGDFLNSLPLGVAGGTILVNGNNQTGQELIIDGITPVNTAGVFKAGDFIQVGSYMYMILKDVTSSAGGGATLDIWPSLRSSPSDNAVVTYVNPKSLWRLTENSGWEVDEAGFYDFSIEAIEAI